MPKKKKPQTPLGRAAAAGARRETREQALARLKREGAGAKPHTGNRGGGASRPKPKPKKPWYKRINPLEPLNEMFEQQKKKEKDE